MPRLRLGVALLLPEPVATEVDGLRRAVGDGALGRIPPHMTLVPPVNVREEHLGRALALLRAAGAAAEPFTLTLGPPDTFLPAAPVLYLAVSGAVDQVHALRHRVFQEPLARPLSWPFVPHVTVADEARPDTIRVAVAAMSRYQVEARFDRVHLLRETEGRQWSSVADAPFSPPAVVGRGGLALELTVTDGLDPEAASFRYGACPGGHEADEVDGPDAARPFAVTARREGTVVAVATGHTRGRHAHIGHLMVDPSARGEGIGRHLVGALQSLAAGRGCSDVTAVVASGTALESFYRGAGWEGGD
ncbi:MAG TPA: GNAT family N-acetyltransferase, partial [Acidimicrobiales bacterium]|nr:GNAT family N-acetyltransferase [Acidimicrobiales bacterium]